MVSILSSIIKNVLSSLYQSFWAAGIISVLVMFFYLYSTDCESAGQGYKCSIKNWLNYFRKSIKFRRMFYLVFYVSMILFRTVLDRKLWNNPLINVIGNWGFYTMDNTSGQMQLTTEPIENIILFIPFSFFLIDYLGQMKAIKKPIIYSTKISFIFSVVIEVSQLVFHLGSFQLSDLFHNTLGGFIGGVICWGFAKLRKQKNQNES